MLGRISLNMEVVSKLTYDEICEQFGHDKELLDYVLKVTKVKKVDKSNNKNKGGK